MSECLFAIVVNQFAMSSDRGFVSPIIFFLYCLGVSPIRLTMALLLLLTKGIYHKQQHYSCMILRFERLQSDQHLAYMKSEKCLRETDVLRNFAVFLKIKLAEKEGFTYSSYSAAVVLRSPFSLPNPLTT